MEHPYYSDWYAKNRERLLPIRKKYNTEYCKRPYVIAKAKIKNATPEAVIKRLEYKKSAEGKIADKRYKDKHKVQTKTRSEKHRLRRYGLDPDKVNLLKQAQNNECKICQKSISVKFHIDHCHKTNKIRGLLCIKCNMALGLFGENIELIKKADNYLENNV